MKKFKVKILLCSYADYDERVASIGITDWEEVTFEEYSFLQQHLYLLPKIDRQKYGNNWQPVMVVQDDVPIMTTFAALKSEVAKELAEIEARKELERRKKEEAKAKREAAKLLSKADGLKKMLAAHPELREALKKELE